MTQLTYAWRLLREISVPHLLLPIILTLLVDTMYAFALSRELESLDLQALQSYWRDHLLSLLVHYFIFLSVLSVLLVRRASVMDLDINILDDILPNATFYHAYGMIPLREWFEPAPTTYLLHLLEFRVRDPQRLGYRRVMLFFSRSDYLATKAHYLDADHAALFADMHRRWKVPLAYLRKRDCTGALATLTDAELQSLGWFRILWSWRPALLRWLLSHERVPIGLLIRRPLHALAFVIVEMRGAAPEILHFAKYGKSLRLEPIQGESKRSAHLKFGQVVDSRVLNAEGQVTAAHNFCSHY